MHNQRQTKQKLVQTSQEIKYRGHDVLIVIFTTTTTLEIHDKKA